MLLKQKTFLYAALFTGFAAIASTQVQAIETTAKNVILIDNETGQYLYTKDHEKMIPPASMSKLMTLYMVFEKLKDGSLSPDDTFTVSENAWRKGGAASGSSTMFLKIGEEIKVEDLIKGIIIQSGNDACIVVAENISGSEEDFANEMNKKAKSIGLKNSHFANATGWPHPDHRMSVEDLAILSRILVSDFPEYYHLFSEKTFTHNGIKQGNRNPLLYSMPYADGLKTGHTEEAGFGLVASAKKDNRRLIGVMAGMNSNKERSAETDKMMSWGFREFSNYTILQKDQKIAEVPVWYGNKESLNLIVGQKVRASIKKNKVSKVKVTAIYSKPIIAPVKKGEKLGTVRIDIPGQDSIEADLIAESDVGKIGIFGRIAKNFKYLLVGAN